MTLMLGEYIDPAGHTRNGTKVELAPSEFCTHGVIVGMTGSGKTGLGIGLIEETLRSGVPCILIDPKGDLANLCLTFPNLAPADFAPWVNDSDATKAGQSPADFAAAQATTWKEGLASWGLGGDQISALRSTTKFTVYTPGSSSGVGLNLIGSLKAPDTDDLEITADEIEGFVSGLLGLVDIEADPLASREHILLSNIISDQWSKGVDLDLPTLVGLIATPPIRKLGVFDLETFYPQKDRMQLAMRLNGLLASASFGAWGHGAPLDIDALLRPAAGINGCAIISIAHLSDSERQFVVSLILSKLITWMRRQSGTSDLRALLYADEVAGYVPPNGNPPTKKPILLLMKQARAFGVGVVLATQNPVDVDYKALSNAGTWMIGRLQTEQDKARLVDGLSAADGGVDVQALNDTISGLAKREFVLRRAGSQKPAVFTTRWTMSYLRGPLTREQVSTLMADQVAAGAVSASAATTSVGMASGDDGLKTAPPLAPGIEQRYIDPSAAWARELGATAGATRLEATVMARVSLLYDDDTADLRHQGEYEAVWYPLGPTVPIDQHRAVDYDDRDLRVEPVPGAVYVSSDAPLSTAAFWKTLERDLVDHLVRNQTMTVQRNKALKLWSRPGESPEDFATRCNTAADEAGDTAAAALREKYEAKAAKLQDAIAAAQDRAEVAEAEAKSKKRSGWLSAAGGLLGGFLGGKKSSKALASSVLRSAGSLAGARGRSDTADKRVDAAENRMEEKVAQLEAVEAELTGELDEINAKWDAVAAEIESVPIPLEKTDVKVTQMVVAWMPVR
jgi:Bacterial protein of unknown function (DUF853)